MVSAADMMHIYSERPHPFNENSLNNMVGPEAPLGEVTMPPVQVVSFDMLDVLYAVYESDVNYEARTIIDDGQKENADELMDELKQKAKLYMQSKTNMNRIRKTNLNLTKLQMSSISTLQL